MDESQLDEESGETPEADTAGAAEAANGDGIPTDVGASPEFDELRNELADYKDKYLRTLAEFDNARKRFAKERGDLLRYQGENVIVDLLEVMDDLERAVEFADTDPAQLTEGVRSIRKKFASALERWEVRGETGLDTQFDPAKFMAIGQTPNPAVEPGTIVNVLKKAYVYKDKLIRVGEVIVAAPPAE